MNRTGAAYPRVGVGVLSAVVLLLVYVATLAPDLTFWDAGEFIAAAHALGIPHPPGTPLYILLLNVWTKLVPAPFAFATNLFSAFATALAVGVMADVVHRATKSAVMALAAALVAGGMSSVWLNATETEVYAAALAVGALMFWSGDRAGREPGERWTFLLAYLIALAVPLHLSALVARSSRNRAGQHHDEGLLATTADAAGRRARAGDRCGKGERLADGVGSSICDSVSSHESVVTRQHKSRVTCEHE